MSKATNKNIFAQRLEELMKENNMIQDDVARAVGVTRQAVGKWLEKGITPNVITAANLARFFNVSLDYLTGTLDVKSTEFPDKIASIHTGLNDKAIASLHKYYVSAIESFRHMEEDAERNLCDTTNDIGYKRKPAIEIINELISNGDIYVLVERLSKLKYDSQTYFEEIELRKNVHQSLYGKSDNRSEAEKKGKSVHSKKEIDQIRERIDLDRYRLNEFIVHLSDRYDQREQVKNNGNNNPTNK